MQATKMQYSTSQGPGETSPLLLHSNKGFRSSVYVRHRDSLSPRHDSIRDNRKSACVALGAQLRLALCRYPSPAEADNEGKIWAVSASTRDDALQQLNSYLVSPFSMRSSPIMPQLIIHDSERMHYTRTSIYCECNFLHIFSQHT